MGQIVACVVKFMRSEQCKKKLVEYTMNYYTLKGYEENAQLTEFEKNERTKYVADRILADARVLYGE